MTTTLSGIAIPLQLTCLLKKDVKGEGYEPSISTCSMQTNTPLRAEGPAQFDMTW